MGVARRKKRAGRAGREVDTGGVRPVSSERTVWVCLLLIVLDLVVYAPVWTHDFTDYDDPTYITENPQVTAGLTWPGVVWAFTKGHAMNWHPLTWLSHMLDVELYGLSPGPHHLTSVVLHIANTLLLFGVLHRMTGQLGRSTVVAALFGVHPLHVESVAWAAERKDVLSTLFWLLTLWAYVQYVRRPAVVRYLAVLGLFALGLMAKPMLVTLPFVLLLLDYWPLGRLSAGGASGDRPASARFIDPRAALRVGLEKVPLLALTVASSIVTFIVQQQGGAVIRLEAFPFWQRAANAMVSYVTYIYSTFWPTRLAVLYLYHPPEPLWWIVASLVLIGVTLVVIWFARRAPYLPVGWFWYVGTLVPVVGLVQVGSQQLADRYTYVPLIGLFVMLAWGIPDALARWPDRRVGLPTAAALAIVVCAIIAVQQVRYWRNSEALWTRTVEVTTDNWIAHSFLGNILLHTGKFEKARFHYSELVRLRPGSADAHNNLGFALARLGMPDDAMAQYTEALRILPGYAEAHNNLGMVLAGRGRVDEAIREFLEALRIKPDYGDAHFNVASMLARKGQLAEAAQHYRDALRENPMDENTQYQLGVILADQGKIEEATRQFETALRLNPRFQKARRALDDLTSRRRGVRLDPR